MNGILPLWKTKGMTSHDCVFKIRKLFQTKKVGHTGTLDPEVEGVLPICIGQSTKIVPFLTETNKTYIAELKLGVATDTEDAHGKVIEEETVNKFPAERQIEEVLNGFIGEITQVPPMYSAVKVNGKKLYEYARANQVVERPTRQVKIFSISNVFIRPEENSISFHVVCSKGTYIRTLCVDIGKKLGYPAHMSGLKRTQVASFTQQEAITLEQVEERLKTTQPSSLLLPAQRGLEHLEHLQVDEETAVKVRNGQKLLKPDKILKEPFVIMFKNELLAIYQTHPEKPAEIKPVRVFNG
ncbi:tRNA pseudouridine(55) synthase TruB [Oceanobacillus manasiensis]|uniref:tRNA pseudouridine(55) synthase TruB n=1 Tax=Oceanobacillus manasiensis TaxID=586413 RepID=UPI0005A867A8|nr:tRNA pseudouridine(55) synthase TruB [Oceanobacillus manasiensis]